MNEKEHHGIFTLLTSTNETCIKSCQLQDTDHDEALCQLLVVSVDWPWWQLEFYLQQKSNLRRNITSNVTYDVEDWVMLKFNQLSTLRSSSYQHQVVSSLFWPFSNCFTHGRGSL